MPAASSVSAAARCSPPTPSSFAVFGMSQNLLDVAKLPIEIQKRNQAIFVTGNVEHTQCSNLINRAKHLAQFRKATEAGCLHCLAPCLQRPTGIVMNRRRFR